MEPNKLENEFKKKLEQRTIQPSNMAWDRLDAMLSVAEKKKKPKRTWMYIAASFLGFILIATLFLNQNNTENTIKDNSTTVVTAPDDEPVKTDSNLTSPKELPQEAPVIQKKQQAVAGAEKIIKKIEEAQPEQKTEVIKNNEPFVQKQVQEAVANNAKSDVQKPMLSADEEAEHLLSASLNKKTRQKTMVKVNSGSLLSNVEGELNESFRDKVLQSVSKNYNTVKTSLANRNRE